MISTISYYKRKRGGRRESYRGKERLGVRREKEDTVPIKFRHQSTELTHNIHTLCVIHCYVINKALCVPSANRIIVYVNTSLRQQNHNNRLEFNLNNVSDNMVGTIIEVSCELVCGINALSILDYSRALPV